DAYTTLFRTGEGDAVGEAVATGEGGEALALGAVAVEGVRGPIEGPVPGIGRRPHGARERHHREVVPLPVLHPPDADEVEGALRRPAPRPAPLDQRGPG